MQNYKSYLVLSLAIFSCQLAKSAAMPLQLEDYSKEQKLKIGSSFSFAMAGLVENILSPATKVLEERKASSVLNAEQKMEGYGGDPLVSSIFPKVIQHIIKEYYVHPMEYFGVVSRVAQMVGSHATLIQTIAITPDATTVVTTSWDNSVKIWRDGNCVATLQHAADMALGAVISKDGKTIVTGSVNGDIKVWDCDGKLEHTINVGVTILSVVIASNGSIAASCHDGKVRIYKQNILTNGFLPEMKRVFALAFASDGSLICTTDGNDIVWCHNDAKSTLLQGHAAHSQGIAIAPDSTIVTGSHDKTAKVWREGKCVATLPHPDPVAGVAIASYRMYFDQSVKEDKLAQLTSNVDNVIVTSCLNKDVRIWKDNECKAVFPSYYGAVVALAVDGTVVTGNENGQVFVFKPDQNLIKKLYTLTFAELEQLKQLTKSIEVLAPEKDGSRKITAEQLSKIVGNEGSFYRCVH